MKPYETYTEEFLPWKRSTHRYPPWKNKRSTDADVVLSLTVALATWSKEQPWSKEQKNKQKRAKEWHRLWIRPQTKESAT